jgi:hypothetical protein
MAGIDQLQQTPAFLAESAKLTKQKLAAIGHNLSRISCEHTEARYDNFEIIIINDENNKVTGDRNTPVEN